MKFRLAAHQLKVIWRYWRRAPFLLDDLRLFGRNPYRVCRRYLERRGARQVHAYGETPLTTLAEIAKWAGIGPSDCVYELGCGPGRTALWLHHFVGCRVVGIDQVPAFVRRAKRVEREGLSFREGDFLQMDYSKASVVSVWDDA
ncbi:MAG: cyclopropane-fatty-acyl-phospholipid synthase family protein [Parachlamydiales bacterium]